MKKLFNFKLCAIFLFSIFVFVSCSDNPTTPEIKSNALGLGSGVTPDESYSEEQITEMFDSIKINAQFWFFKLLNEGITQDGNYYSQILKSVSAEFWIQDITFPPENFEETLHVPVNSVQINEKYLSSSPVDNVYSDTSVSVYFGTQPNHIVVSDNIIFPNLDTNFKFYSEIQFQSPKVGDVIYSNQNATIRWNGGSNGKVKLSIYYLLNDGFGVVMLPKTMGFISDDGQFTINSSDLRDTTAFPAGEYIFVLDRYETFFPKFSNGKTYSVIGTTSNYIRIKLKH